MASTSDLTGTFLVKFGPRIKKIEVNCNITPFRSSLESTIRRAMMGDPMLKTHALKGFFLTQPDVTSNFDIEIDDSTEFWQVDTDRPIELMLHSTSNFEIPSVPPNGAQSHPNRCQSNQPAQTKAQVATVPHKVAEYLENIGMNVHITPTETPVVEALVETEAEATTPKCSSKQQRHESHQKDIILSSPPARRGKKRRSEPESPESPVGEYLEKVLKRREALKELANQLVPKEAPKLRSVTKKQEKKKGKENIERRIMPKRAAKDKPKDSTDETEPETDKAGPEESSSTGEVPQASQGPLSTNTKRVVQLRVVGNFHKLKDNRPIGKWITRSTPLPPFPKKLKQSFESGIYDTRALNKFLKDHVENVTGVTSITKGEYKILGEQVSNRFKAMKLINAEGYSLKVKKKLSDCFRNARYYPKKKARRVAKRKAKRAAAALNVSLEETLDDTAEDDAEPQDEVEPQDDADMILQKPVVNKQSVKMCITKSTKRIPFIKTHAVQVVLNKYPYLKEADLLIYEYSTRVPMPLDMLEEHYAKYIPSLSHILNEALPSHDDEQAKLMLFKKLEDYFSGGENHIPSIQFCEASNRNAVPLNSIPKGQAPALVILKDDTKLLRSATLIFDGGILTTASNPSAFDCITLLMAGYWVFDLDYPNPYKQHMESIEQKK
ncbi:uncharacterized protein LOC117647890 [Thrips palmi]|uniref:Uncharacterized protein LOC117647890 n=1 Tax=Thrips palmi TaxID=161013 RepID=A0A6P8Z6D1_THRPL|nr:uncharacterized protein LOC117647890 [Thrips palmi]